MVDDSRSQNNNQTNGVPVNSKGQIQNQTNQKVYYSSNPNWKPSDPNAKVIYTNKKGVPTSKSNSSNSSSLITDNGLASPESIVYGSIGQSVPTSKSSSSSTSPNQTLQQVMKPKETALSPYVNSYIISQPTKEPVNSYAVPQRVSSGGASYTNPQMPVARYAGVTEATQATAQTLGGQVTTVLTLGNPKYENVPILNPFMSGGFSTPKKVGQAVSTGAELGAYFVPYLGETLLAEQSVRGISTALDKSKSGKYVDINLGPLGTLREPERVVGAVSGFTALGLLGVQAKAFKGTLKSARESDLFRNAPVRLSEGPEGPLSTFNTQSNTLNIIATKETSPNLIDRSLLGVKKESYLMESKIPVYQESNKLFFEGGQGAIQKVSGNKAIEITGFNLGGTGRIIESGPKQSFKGLTVQDESITSGVSKIYSQKSAFVSMDIQAMRGGTNANVFLEGKDLINQPKNFGQYFGVSKSANEDMFGIMGGKITKARMYKDNSMSVLGKPSEFGRIKIVNEKEFAPFEIMGGQAKGNLPEETITFYHGTSSLYKKDILEKGFSMPENYFSKDVADVQGYASRKVYGKGMPKEGETIALFKVELPKSVYEQKIINRAESIGGKEEIVLSGIEPRYIKDISPNVLTPQIEKSLVKGEIFSTSIAKSGFETVAPKVSKSFSPSLKVSESVFAGTGMYERYSPSQNLNYLPKVQSSLSSSGIGNTQFNTLGLGKDSSNKYFNTQFDSQFSGVTSKSNSKQYNFISPITGQTTKQDFNYKQGFDYGSSFPTFDLPTGGGFGGGGGFIPPIFGFGPDGIGGKRRKRKKKKGSTSPSLTAKVFGLSGAFPKSSSFGLGPSQFRLLPKGAKGFI